MPGLDAATGGESARALASKEFAGKPFELFVHRRRRGWRARRVVLIGAGPAVDAGSELLRQAGGGRRACGPQRVVSARAAFLMRGTRRIRPSWRRRSPKG